MLFIRFSAFYLRRKNSSSQQFTNVSSLEDFIMAEKMSEVGFSKVDSCSELYIQVAYFHLNLLRGLLFACASYFFALPPIAIGAFALLCSEEESVFTYRRYFAISVLRSAFITCRWLVWFFLSVRIGIFTLYSTFCLYRGFAFCFF